jgi:hypothetical protein
MPRRSGTAGTASQLIAGVFGGPAVGKPQRRGLAPRRRRNTAVGQSVHAGLHLPRSRPTACARNQQLVGKNRQLMSSFGNSAIGAPPDARSSSPVSGGLF